MADPENVIRDYSKGHMPVIAELAGENLCIYLKNLKGPLIRLMDSKCPDAFFMIDTVMDQTEPDLSEFQTVGTMRTKHRPDIECTMHVLVNVDCLSKDLAKQVYAELHVLSNPLNKITPETHK